MKESRKYVLNEIFEQTIKKVDQIKKIAEAKDAEVAHVVLAWYLTRETIDVVIPGAKSAEQVVHNLKTLEIKL